MTLLQEARTKLRQLAATYKWNENEKVHIVSAHDLTPAEAIGKPDRDDYPLLTGKEVMMEARFRGSAGQAFTDRPGRFEGTFGEVLQLPLDTNFRRAVFVATLNAVLRNLQQIKATVHCKDSEPALCAQKLPSYIQLRYGQPKIAFIGLQPGLIQALKSAGFDMRVTDLNPDNIGQIRCGVQIEDAARNVEHVRWADIVLATGSVLVNDTYQELQQGKPVIYYGVTAAGLAKLFDLPRICFCGR
ncbi:Rossmann-like domain-containing protein [Sporomusa sphaeroides]|uniref:Putative heavy-metal chelation domain-containing protein n=2 Tax=Sporomusa TaxID=2375 RepID=A0ABM9VYM3_9FIRM|nr:DUF364 domain-containing protein [Sporomusa sphaeroides]OLS57451.1 hypothetical protein SPSPH_09670 [Sporomusa sphaeroides DSM 2875]CVK17985.1 hypothetical protein SSPH_00621 [Sporomusa sphaeroides DSM 2875]SCM81215.1 conserved hypothetical protein [uncultured Sporomusa sp.]